jgi:hypothetical protein
LRRVLAQLADHGRQAAAQRMLRMPAQQVLGARDVEFVVVVGQRHHEGLDERFLAAVDRVGDHILHPVLQPGAGGGHGLRDLPRFPGLAVHQPSDQVLQCFIAFGDRLTDEDRGLFRQLRAPVDRGAEGARDIVLVHERLAMRRIAGKHVALHLPFVNALDLVRQGRHFAIIGIDACNAQHQHRDMAAFRMQDALGIQLRLRVGPGRVQRRVFGDRIAGLGRRMDQHRAGIDELLDLERLQRAQQALRALDVDLVVQRVGVAGEIVERRQMNHRRETVAVTRTQLVASLCQRLLGSNVGVDAIAALAGALEADHGIRLLQLGADRLAEPAFGTGDQYDRFLLSHMSLPLMRCPRTHDVCHLTCHFLHAGNMQASNAATVWTTRRRVGADGADGA